MSRTTAGEAIENGAPGASSVAGSRGAAPAAGDGLDARGAATHEVFNQPPPLEDYNPYEADPALAESVRREGAEWAEERIRGFGEVCGSAEVIRLGFEANEKVPQLRTHDRFGHRIDEVEFDRSWHELMALGVSNGLHCLPWREPGPGANVARGAMFMLLAHAEAGVGCPLSMTYSAVPALRRQPEIAAEWEPRLTSTAYDGSSAPAPAKPGALCGMAMTEKQGGSDVRANTTSARPLAGGGAGGEYAITGHKWFCSAPMCDAFLVLAKAPEGLSCFLVPRWTPDGERNPFRIQRLKDKLGNRSNASSEIELVETLGTMIGEEGRGVATIIEMVNRTRLDCVLGGAAGMRAGLAQAIHHASHREAFGRRLADQPLMGNVLADLAVESEAATIAAMRLCRAYDDGDAAAGGDAEGSGEAELFRRLATPVLKYWICKRAPWHAVEALECLGGNGYVEESGMPRLYRESPLGSIWEGSGNVQCLDVLRAMGRSPGSVEAFMAEVEGAAADAEGLGAPAARAMSEAAERLGSELTSDMSTLEPRARRVVELMALVLQGALLVRNGDEAVAAAFCASRLGGDWGNAFGTLPAGTDFDRIIERHSPSTW